MQQVMEYEVPIRVHANVFAVCMNHKWNARSANTVTEM